MEGADCEEAALESGRREQEGLLSVVSVLGLKPVLVSVLLFRFFESMSAEREESERTRGSRSRGGRTSPSLATLALQAAPLSRLRTLHRDVILTALHDLDLVPRPTRQTLAHHSFASLNTHSKSQWTCLSSSMTRLRTVYEPLRAIMPEGLRAG